MNTATAPAACGHRLLTTLEVVSGGGVFDDHQTELVRCTCGGYFIATVWFTRTQTDVAHLTAAQRLQYAELMA